MIKQENHTLHVEIPYSLFVRLKVLAMNGRYRGVKEFIKPKTDEFISNLVQIVTNSEAQNQLQAIQNETIARPRDVVSPQIA